MLSKETVLQLIEILKENGFTADPMDYQEFGYLEPVSSKRYRYASLEFGDDQFNITCRSFKLNEVEALEMMAEMSQMVMLVNKLNRVIKEN